MCVIVVLALWQIYAYQRVESYDTDGSYYQVLAHNLAHQHDYVFNSRAHTRYPPGFPLFLALASLLTGEGYPHVIVLMPLLAALGLIASWMLLEGEDHWAVASVACLWLASSPHFFSMATRHVWSDLPYFFVSSVALLLAAKLQSSSRASPGLVIGLAIFMAAAVTIRSAGVSLLAAGVATLAFSRHAWTPSARRGLAVAVAAGVGAEAAWFAWARAHVSSDWPGEYMNSYVTQIMMTDPHRPALGHATVVDVVVRMGGFAAAQMARFSQLVIRAPWLDQVWYSPLIIVPGVLITIGLIDAVVRRRSTLIAWYVVAYLGLYALWPFDEETRFTIPVFPLLFLFAWRGIRRLSEMVETRGSRLILVVPVLGLLAIAAFASWASARAPGRQAMLYVVFWVAAFVAALIQYLFRPVRHGTAAIAGRYGWACAICLFLLCLGGGLVQQARIAAENVRPRPERFTHAGVVSVAEWLRSQPERGLMMAQQAAILHRLTGRRIVAFPVTSDARVIDSVLRTYHVSYLAVVDSKKDEYFEPTERARLVALVSAEPGCCHLIRAGDGYRIYRIGLSQ